MIFQRPRYPANAFILASDPIYPFSFFLKRRTQSIIAWFSFPLCGKLKTKNQDLHYVDAACYPNRQAYAVAVTEHHGNELACATIPTSIPAIPEETAIALTANIASESIIIVIDSQEACRHYHTGRIALLAIRIMIAAPTLPDKYVIWVTSEKKQR